MAKGKLTAQQSRDTKDALLLAMLNLTESCLAQMSLNKMSFPQWLNHLHVSRRGISSPPIFSGVVSALSRIKHQLTPHQAMMALNAGDHLFTSLKPDLRLELARFSEHLLWKQHNFRTVNKPAQPHDQDIFLLSAMLGSYDNHPAHNVGLVVNNAHSVVLVFCAAEGRGWRCPVHPELGVTLRDEVARRYLSLTYDRGSAKLEEDPRPASLKVKTHFFQHTAGFNAKEVT